ncbi:MAG: cysteine desulfurase NifS [Spirochaetales bacterium]|nr:cysteine desulfurase NifS [Spirochaetales bacterium]
MIHWKWWNMKDKTIYLDNNATTAVAPEVVEAMLPFFTDSYGNPSSMHNFGGRVHRELEKAREKVAQLLSCEPYEIIFTSCGTESANFALRGIMEAYPEKRHIITTKVEHPCIKNQIPWFDERGVRVTELRVDRKGRLDLDELSAAITKNTLLISCMYANNETGVIFPVDRIASMARERGVYFHTDAVQAVGKIKISLKDLPVDLLSFSGHKLHAPKGVGVLYVRRGTKIRPFIIGGHQERNLRGGTENVPYIIGLGKACELAAEHLFDENNQVKKLRDKLEKGILASIPNTEVNGHTEDRLPNTTNIGIHFVEGEALLLALSKENICASTGSACASGSLQPSHVLRAMGIPFTSIHGSLRLSLSRYNTESEIDQVLEILPGIVDKLRAISPFKNLEDVTHFGTE